MMVQQSVKADRSAGGPYKCPYAKNMLKLHTWLLHDGDTTISDASMSFEVTVVCQNCGREESFYGAIMDWKQHERWKAGYAPGEPAEEDE